MPRAAQDAGDRRVRDASPNYKDSLKTHGANTSTDIPTQVKRRKAMLILVFQFRKDT
jgi:hypothetical protein